MEYNRQQLIQQGQAVVQAAPQLYLDIDVEADGKTGYGSLLSIGAISPWGETFYQELRPSSELWVQSQHDFCENHGLSRERLLQEGRPPAEAIADLSNWQAKLKAKYHKSRSVLVAYNASFDYPLIDLEYLRAEQVNPFGIAGYCIKSLAMALGNNYDWLNTSKNRLPEDILPDDDITHQALEDATYQQALHFAMIGKLICEKGLISLPDSN
jgi:DNA polymerase III epsilon subunit-like protein